MGSRGKPGYIRNAEVRLLFAQLDTDYPLRRRDHCAFHFLLHLGLKVGELVKIRHEVDIQGKRVSLRKEEGHARRELQMSEPVRRSLNEWMKAREELTDRFSPYLFVTARSRRLQTTHLLRRVKRVAEQAGIERNLTPQRLRDTFAINVALLHLLDERSVKPSSLAEFLRRILGLSPHTRVSHYLDFAGERRRALGQPSSPSPVELRTRLRRTLGDFRNPHLFEPRNADS